MDEINKKDQIVNDPNFLQKICDHISCGGTLVEFCTDNKLRYVECIRWLNADAERQKDHKQALLNRREFTSELMLHELKSLSTMNISDIYNDDGEILPLHKMPVGIQKCIESFEYDKVSGKAKIKFVNKLKAIEVHSKTTDLLTQKIEISASETMEQIIGRSFKVNNE